MDERTFVLFVLIAVLSTAIIVIGMLSLATPAVT